MFPPPAAFSYIFTNESHRVNNSTYTTKSLFNEFNFSGHGAFIFYKIFCAKKWKIKLNNVTDSQAKQIVFHCMFGTFKEDLGLLAAITNQATWNTREELGNVFQNTANIGRVAEFEPIKQIYYAKLSQANQSGLLTSSYFQVSAIPCFSEKSKRTYGDAFFDHLENDKTKAIGGRSIQALISSYSELKEELRQLLENNRTLTMGTTN